MSSRPSKKSRKSGDSSAKIARLSEPLQECYQILKFFQSRPDADPFTEPVDWEAFGLMDYPEIITHPMDLGTVQVRQQMQPAGAACRRSCSLFLPLVHF